MREHAETISKRMEYYELAADKEFQDEYIKSLLKSLHFPHADLSKYPETEGQL
jgi:uncharacterized 2Fe-2S/4Fe-4S cluster protein (DUF4445 family)